MTSSRCHIVTEESIMMASVVSTNKLNKSKGRITQKYLLRKKDYNSLCIGVLEQTETNLSLIIKGRQKLTKFILINIYIARNDSSTQNDFKKLTLIQFINITTAL